jgi:hypothetical protein
MIMANDKDKKTIEQKIDFVNQYIAYMERVILRANTYKFRPSPRTLKDWRDAEKGLKAFMEAYNLNFNSGYELNMGCGLQCQQSQSY